jgi:hypothetical protein
LLLLIGKVFLYPTIRVRVVVKKSFRSGTGKGEETNQTASFARWLLAASAVNVTSHCLIMFDTTEEDKNRGKIVRPGATYRTAGAW